MAFSLPDGSKFFIGTALGSALTVSALSNANPAVATATNSLTANDELLMTSGWDDVNGTVYRAGAPSGTTFQLLGLDSTNTAFFPAGSGTGTAQKVTTWQEITQLTDIKASGGDPQYATVDLLSKRNQMQIPARFNATSLTLTAADDPTLAGYQAVLGYSRTLTPAPLKILMGGGSTAYGYGYFALNEMPQLNKGQINTISIAIALIGRLIRYSS